MNNQFKIVRIEYNVRPVNDLGNVRFDPVAFHDELEVYQLHGHEIWIPNVCLLDFDLEGLQSHTDIPVLYDLAIVKTEKPLEYWLNIFK